MKLGNKQAFTLVELIVVITILAILGTIAFLSFNGYSSSARDSARLTDVDSLAKGMEVMISKGGTLPRPSNAIDIKAGTTTIGYQGYADKTVLGMIGMSDSKDPLDSIYYTYSVNASQNKYQILGFLESSDSIAYNISPLIDSVYAEPASYSGRTVFTKGNALGILLSSGTLLPVQAISVTSIDTAGTSTGYITYFETKDSTASLTGNLLFSNIYNRRKDLLTDKTLAASDPTLVGYWDMETMSGGRLWDWSSYGNSGTLNGGVVVGGVKEKNGKAILFNGVIGQNITIPNNSVFDIGTNNDFTIFVLAKTPTKQTYSSGGYHYNCLLEKWGSTYPFTVRIKDQNDITGYDVNSFGYPGKMGSFRYDGTNNPGVYSNRIIADDTFHSLVFTKNKQKLFDYIDGSKDSESLDTTTGNTISTSVIAIGTCTNGGLPYSGIIDEVRIYNRSLSDSEISALYNTTK